MIIPAVMLVRLGVVATMPAVFWVERPIRSFAPDFVWPANFSAMARGVSATGTFVP